MPNYRRYFVPGGTYFFTLVTQNRARILMRPDARAIFRDVLRECQQKYAFEIVAIVILPDHLHTIWSLPRGDTRYAIRWGWIKSQFTRRWIAANGTEQSLCKGAEKEGRRGVWQARYWEHTITDERDLENHANYIHFNPVKHGHVSRPRDWQWSSFHRFVEEGEYEINWGSQSVPLGLPTTVGE